MSPLEPLETPSFTTMTRNVPQVMLRLNWDHKVNLIGEKVLNPMIYCCDQCTKPILIYGRMIQCKHVFCLTCARTEAVLKICPRCNEKVVRVEQTGLGTVFMCTHGGTRYGKTGCRRTYLSQRDLQAHINHRHVMIPAPLPMELKTTEKPSLLAATATIGGQQQQPPLNSHLRKVRNIYIVELSLTVFFKDSMVQPPPVIKQPFNSSAFQTAPPSGANKMSHHSQDMHGFYNNQHGSAHQFGSNGAGSSSGNNFYQPFNSNMGHYSVSSVTSWDWTISNLEFLSTATRSSAATATTELEPTATTTIFQINSCSEVKNFSEQQINLVLFSHFTS